MDMIADALLIAGAAGAALYCRILANRLNALKNLDSGLGAAIASLSRQVDEMRVSLETAKAASGDQTRALSQLTARGEMAAGRLELLLAALHENGRRRPIAVREDDAGPRRATVEAPEADEAEPPAPPRRSAALAPFAHDAAATRSPAAPVAALEAEAAAAAWASPVAAPTPAEPVAAASETAPLPEAPALRWSAAP